MTLDLCVARSVWVTGRVVVVVVVENTTATGSGARCRQICAARAPSKKKCIREKRGPSTSARLVHSARDGRPADSTESPWTLICRRTGDDAVEAESAESVACAACVAACVGVCGSGSAAMANDTTAANMPDMPAQFADDRRLTARVERPLL